MAKNVFDDPKDKVDFNESWLNTTVEMAALGTILAGAGTLAIKGDLTDGVRTGKQALGAMSKGFENYINRKGSVGSKFGLQVGKRTFQNLKKMPTSENDGHNELAKLVSKTREELENDPQEQLRIRRIVAKKMANQNSSDVVDDVLDGTNKSKDDVRDQVRFLYEQTISDEVKKSTGLKPKFERRNNKRNNDDKKPLFDRRELVKNMTTSGLAGLAFGGGISGFHAIDRMSGNPDTQKKLEDAYSFGGSFLNRKDDQSMDKKAGSLETYNKLKQLGGKTPEAVATGLGFTGVSLGAASLLNKSKEKKEQEKPEDQKTRVIIELGNDEEQMNQNMGQHPSLASLPKLSSQQPKGMEKLSYPSPEKLGLGQFLKDLRGHGKEIDQLKAINPADQAAERLRDADVPNLVKKEYGNLVNDKTEANFTNSLFQRTSDKAQKEIDDQIKALETRTADARLKAGGGALLAGGGLATLGARRKQEESHGDSISQ